MRLGILSTARINEMILRGAALTNRVDVTAVASRDPEHAATYGRSHGISRNFGSYEELLADPDIDAVYISLPNSLHATWSIRALEAKKHVLCEKPLTRDPKEAERLFEVAERSGRVLIEGFMYQHHPQTKRLLEIVNQQAIGPLRVIRSCLRYTVASEADIRLSSSLAGGSLMDLGCYCVHSARSLAGEPERVYAERVVGPNGVEVALLGTLRFRHDVVAQFDSSFVTPMWQELEVVGEAGSARVAAPFRVDLGRPGIKLARRKVEMVQVEEGDSYALELEYFADVAEGKISTASAEDSIGQARTLAALYESVERGLPVDL